MAFRYIVSNLCVVDDNGVDAVMGMAHPRDGMEERRVAIHGLKMGLVKLLHPDSIDGETLRRAAYLEIEDIFRPPIAYRKAETVDVFIEVDEQGVAPVTPCRGNGEGVL